MKKNFEELMAEEETKLEKLKTAVQTSKAKYDNAIKRLKKCEDNLASLKIMNDRKKLEMLSKKLSDSNISIEELLDIIYSQRGVNGLVNPSASDDKDDATSN